MPLRALIREILLESVRTPRVSDLDIKDIVAVLEDMLREEPFLSYTEKLAGQFLEVRIDRNRDDPRRVWVGAVFKQQKEEGYSHNLRHDAGACAATLRTITIPPEMIGKTYRFEVIKEENRPDYIDYALGGTRTLAVEFTGALSKEQATYLNSQQSNVKYMSREEITKAPRPISPELRQKIEGAIALLKSGQKIRKAQKEEIENLLSVGLAEIFGESVLGGRFEGIFVSGQSLKEPEPGAEPEMLGFKMPEAGYANIQRVSVPLYAAFAKGDGQYGASSTLQRLKENPLNDRLIANIKTYLQAASAGFPSGFKTFFSPQEAADLLDMLEMLISQSKSAALDPSQPIDERLFMQFYRTLTERIVNKRQWVQTG
jgi:hypothetical protein